MQTFYVIIKKECLSLYEKKGDLYERVYLGGNSEYYYNVNSAVENIKHLLEMIVEEYNLDTIAEVNLIAIENEDEIISSVVLNAFGAIIKKKISITKLMSYIIDNLKRDEKLHISEYGVNYDGKKYIPDKQGVNKEEFSLLAYTLSDDMLMKFVG